MNVVNSAEILEYTNSNGFLDRDSVAGNGEEKEDDYGQVMLMVSVATGATMIENLGTIFISAVLIAVIIILIKKRSTKKFYR